MQNYVISFQSALKWLYLLSPSATPDTPSRVLVIDAEGHLQALQLGTEESEDDISSIWESI
jgi:hypothetical protein